MSIFTLHPLAFASERAIITPPEIGKSITLTFQPDPHRAGNFDSIEINAIGKNFRFVPKVPIAHIPSDADDRSSTGLWDKIPGLKLDPSRDFFRGEYLSDNQPHTLLFFVSEPGIEASPLLVIGFSYVGQPYKVLELDSLDVASFQQAGDDDALIVGKTTLSQVMAGDGGNGSKAPYATTYDPYSVFIAHMEGKAYYSLTASRRYNEDHYVWAGPHAREDYAVLYNLPKHPTPLGAPASRIEALLGSAKGRNPQ
jgi:hypothetical protein